MEITEQLMQEENLMQGENLALRKLLVKYSTILTLLPHYVDYTYTRLADPAASLFCDLTLGSGQWHDKLKEFYATGWMGTLHWSSSS